MVADYSVKTREDDRRGGVRKLSDEQEQEIAVRFRAGGMSKSALAREYGVSQPTITAIVNRQPLWEDYVDEAGWG